MAAGIKQNLHFRHINSKQFQRRGSDSRRVKDIGGRPIMVVPPNIEPNLCCSLRGKEAFGGKDGEMSLLEPVVLQTDGTNYEN